MLFQATKIVIHNQYNKQVVVFFRNGTLVGFFLMKIGSYHSLAKKEKKKQRPSLTGYRIKPKP